MDDTSPVYHWLPTTKKMMTDILNNSLQNDCHGQLCALCPPTRPLPCVRQTKKHTINTV